MPRKRSNDEIACRYFRWILVQRNGLFYADGRSNQPKLGRHSLGTRARDEALQQLSELDLTMAVSVGRADATLLQPSAGTSVSLEEGRDLYLQHCGRGRTLGGVKPKTIQRYRAIIDKAIAFWKSKDIDSWHRVNVQAMEAYGTWLDDEDYLPATSYIEITTLKQCLKYLALDAKVIPVECIVKLHVRRADGSNRYCWSPDEVAAMLNCC